MTNKEYFIQDVENLVDQLSEKGLEYFETLKKNKKETKQFTENGKKILKFMQEHYDEYNNIFTSKIIAEGLFTSARSISGSLTKLANDEYIEKIKTNENITYKIVKAGQEAQLDN